MTRFLVASAAFGSLIAASMVVATGAAYGMEVGTRHSTGSSWSRYSGTSKTTSTLNGSVEERTVSGSVGHGFNGSFGGRTDGQRRVPARRRGLRHELAAEPLQRREGRVGHDARDVRVPRRRVED